MIPSVLTGQTLIDDIDASAPLAGEIDLWWMGQSGFVVKTSSALLHFDLYLSDSLTRKYASSGIPHTRMTELPVEPWLIRHARSVFASHTHTDHFDPDTLKPLLAASPQARLILPLAIRQRAVDLGLDEARIIPLRGDDAILLDAGIHVHAIPSAHPDLSFTDENGYSFLGFVVQVDGLTIYHSGDTILYDGLAERLTRFEVDIAFLPINGANPRLKPYKIAPNMSASDAVALARRCHFRLTIPHHYDMFTFNTADPLVFADQARAAGIGYTVLRPGARYTYTR